MALPVLLAVWVGLAAGELPSLTPSGAYRSAEKPEGQGSSAALLFPNTLVAGSLLGPPVVVLRPEGCR